MLQVGFSVPRECNQKDCKLFTTCPWCRRKNILLLSERDSDLTLAHAVVSMPTKRERVAHMLCFCCKSIRSNIMLFTISLYRVLTLAPRRVAVGSLRTAPALLMAQTLATTELDHCPGRGRLRTYCADVFSNGGPIGQKHFGVGCDLLICCLPRSLQDILVTQSWSGLPPGTGQGLHGPQPSQLSQLSHSVLVKPVFRPPALACTGHSPAHPRRRTLWGRAISSVPALAAPSPSMFLACNSCLQPGPARR